MTWGPITLSPATVARLHRIIQAALPYVSHQDAEDHKFLNGIMNRLSVGVDDFSARGHDRLQFKLTLRAEIAAEYQKAGLPAPHLQVAWVDRVRLLWWVSAPLYSIGPYQTGEEIASGEICNAPEGWEHLDAIVVSATSWIRTRGYGP